jgi:plastocyanin domain-containing protein
VKRGLPLNAPVTIEFTPAKAGDIAFACGMNMLKGVIVVQ